MPLAWFLPHFQSLSLLHTRKLGPSGSDSPMGGFVYVLGLHGSPMNSPVRLGVYPTATTLIDFYSQRF